MSQPLIPQYRAFGEPAWGNIVFKNTPSITDTITINGDTYTYNIDYFGTDPLRAAQSLAAAIRADLQVSHLNVSKKPIRPYTAYYYGNTVVVAACNPGTAGNSIAMATNNTANYIVDANLANGSVAAGGGSSSIAPSVGALTDGSAAITTGGTSQQVFAASAARKYFLFQNISDTAMELEFGGAATANSLSVPAGTGFIMESSFVTNQTINVLCATTGKRFVAKEA